MSIVTEKCFRALMDHYRAQRDPEKQIALIGMDEKDILIEYLNVFGLEGGIYE